MGLFWSRPSAHIELEKSVYTGGELLRGTAYLHAVDKLEVDVMILRIVGEERTKWTEKHPDSLHRARHKSIYNHCVTHTGWSQLLGAEITLSGKGTIQKGAYAYPFELVLPANLPGSLDWSQQGGSEGMVIRGATTVKEVESRAPKLQRKGDQGRRSPEGRGIANAKACIIYYVQAVCVEAGRSSDSWMNIKSDPLPFTLLPASPVPCTGPVEASATLPLMVLGCIPRGRISGGMAMSANAAQAGSRIAVKGHLENKSPAPIMGIEVKLLQLVDLDSRCWSSSWTQYKKFDLRLPPYVNRYSDSGMLQAHLGFVNNVGNAQFVFSPTDIKPGAAPNNLETQLQVPDSLTSTLQGSVIKIQYCLEFVGKREPQKQSFKVQAPLVISPLPPMMSPRESPTQPLYSQPSTTPAAAGVEPMSCSQACNDDNAAPASDPALIPPCIHTSKDDSMKSTASFESAQNQGGEFSPFFDSDSTTGASGIQADLNRAAGEAAGL